MAGFRRGGSNVTDVVEQSGIKRRGFASMSPERRKEIAAMGGKSVLKANRTFSKNKDLAAAAGRKGGKLVPAKRRSFAQDPLLASIAGRQGAAASIVSRRKKKAT